MQKTLAWIITVLAILGIASSYYRDPALLSGTTSATVPPEYLPELALDKKVPDTRTYFSDRLGVGFTYYAPYKLKVEETGSVIRVGDKTIEVFTIAPTTDVATAVRLNFLHGIDDQDCFVAMLPIVAAPYQAASINFPISDDTDGPWWDSAAAQKCPAVYREANGIGYFLMNTKVPNKLLFVKLGQDSIATDGTPEADGRPLTDWSDSIRIFR